MDYPPNPTPWTAQQHEVNSTIYANDGHFVATVHPHCNADYIVACMNIIAGRDPDKLKALLEKTQAVSSVMSKDICGCSEEDDPCVYCELRESIDSFNASSDSNKKESDRKENASEQQWQNNFGVS